MVQYYGCLPQSLRDILDKDNDAVLNRRLLTKVPSAYPIDVILHEVGLRSLFSSLTGYVRKVKKRADAKHQVVYLEVSNNSARYWSHQGFFKLFCSSYLRTISRLLGDPRK